MRAGVGVRRVQRVVAVVALLVLARLFMASFDTDSYILFPRVRLLLLPPVVIHTQTPVVIWWSLSHPWL